MNLANCYPESVNLIAKALRVKYQDFNHHNKKNPLDELVFILCSVKRSEKVYLLAYKALKHSYPSYKDILKTSPQEISNRVPWGGLQNQKSVNLINILSAIKTRFGKTSLAELRYMTENDCESFLCSLPGVGKKIARCVMLFSLNIPVFPVDSNCWRISIRLGWIKTYGKRHNCSSKEMDALQNIIPSRLRLSLHVNMVSLGRDICLDKRPKCEVCPISKYCPKVEVGHPCKLPSGNSTKKQAR